MRRVSRNATDGLRIGHAVNVEQELQQFGISESVTRAFSNGDDPDLVNYLDLIGRPINAGNVPASLDGAVEHDHRPVLYYVDASRLSNAPETRSEQLGHFSRSISSRGERAYLAVVKPGLLEVAPIRLGETQPTWQPYRADSSEAINFYSNLVHGNIPGQEADDPDLVFDVMYKLLLTGADQIAHRIGKDNVLSLVGRALFFRFLCDREIVTETDTHKICSQASKLRACFDNSENAYHTSNWLDRTFNGHFLPLSERGTHQFFEELNRSAIVFKNLSAIVRGLEPVGNSQFQHRFDWGIFKFEHVPVGLLSQVYEAFSWEWDRENAEETSVHYTPRNIALTLVEEAFEGLENRVDARILDPACGAGVFLVLAFRRLYTENWRASGTRPNTKVIRNILEKQLCGFDISESALRLAALSLYLTAIELDPHPIPPEKLKFKDLNNLILFNQRQQSEAVSGPVVGSLRPDVGERFDSKFDLVLCNPPWSKIDNVSVVSGLDAASKQIVSRKDELLGRAYQNPRGEPDLPFLWKATEWCRPSGQIAMVLPSRILFRQSEVATEARTALFRQIRFTGIVNCSNIRKTNVWPDMDQPFMLAFARNERPDKDSTFWFISPQADHSLNRLGEVRIDANAAHVLNVDEVIEEYWLLKTLAVGTWLDVDVIRRIRQKSDCTLDDYWCGNLNLNLTSRQGYTVDGTPPKDASSMKVLLDVGDARKTPSRFTIIPELYKKFNHDTLYRTLIIKKDPNPLRVYYAPLLLLRQSLPKDRQSGNALSSYVDIAYNKSFYGYSAFGHSDAVALIQFLHVFSHTTLWSYFALCTSAKLGFERTYFYKEDFDSFPIIPLAELNEDQRNQIAELAKRLESEDETVFDDIDLFFGTLYGLTKRDIRVIEDTLTVRNPHDEFGVRGSTPPTGLEMNQFCSMLRTALGPFVRKLGRQLFANIHDGDENSTFRFLTLSVDECKTVSSDKLRQIVIELANRTGASIIIQLGDAGLIIGILNQYRYWTRSRARLLAADILRGYFTAFEEGN